MFLVKLQRSFFIIFLILTCPAIFYASSQQAPKSANQQELDHSEILEDLMSQAREQTNEIACCIQQLEQSIIARKIHLTKMQAMHVLSELRTIREFTRILIEQLFVQSAQVALHDAITINHVLIDYLLTTLQTNIVSIKSSAISDRIHKKSMHKLPHEFLYRLARKNEINLKKLIYAADRVGLTWYNYFYRSLKKNNAYALVKGTAISAISLVAISLILCHCDIDSEYWLSPSLQEYYDKWIGKCPHLNGQSGQWVVQPTPAELAAYSAQPNHDQVTELNHLFGKPLVNPTPTQKLIMILKNLQSTGIITLGALVAINLKDIFSYLYQDSFDWAYAHGAKKLQNIDKQLQGTAKRNLSDDGYERVYFKDMVGCEELEALAKKIANFMKHPERYERSEIEEHRGILLYGPPQTGKTLFAKALRTLVEEELGKDQKVHFINAKEYYDRHWPVRYVFEDAAYYAPCIIFFDEIDLVGTHRDKDPFSTSQLLTCMQGMDVTSKQIFVIGATNRPEQLDQALLVDGRFGKRIHIEYPKYKYRKIFLEQQLEKRCISLSPEYIDYIAQETEGASYNNLKRIITEALILSSIEKHPVCQQDFEKTLDVEIRKILPAQAMSEQEKRIIATYQAGKAVARHILQTHQEVVKITINPVIKDVKTTEATMVIKTNGDSGDSDNEKLTAQKKEQKIKLGEVFTKSTSNHNELVSDKEQENECLALLAGNAALLLMTNESYTQCNKQDRAEVMQLIYNLISSGEKVNDKLRAQAITIKDEYEKQIFKLLSNHKDLLEKIINLLMKQNTIDRYEWKALIKTH